MSRTSVGCAQLGENRARTRAKRRQRLGRCKNIISYIVAESTLIVAAFRVLVATFIHHFMQDTEYSDTNINHVMCFR